MSSDPTLRSWAEIDLAALAENVRLLNQRAGRENQLLAVVKANAYGHGLEEIARSLAKLHVRGFGVANIREGLRVLAATAGLSETPPPYIVILSPVLPAEIEVAVKNGFACSVSTLEEVEQFDLCAQQLGKSVKLHAVADTGMGRMGAKAEQWPILIETILARTSCELVGMATHFPSADEDADFTRQQIRDFQNLITPWQSHSIEIHLANSAGILDFSDEIPYSQLVRAGLAMYGVSPDCQNALPLQRVLTLKSRISLIRQVEPGTSISYGGTFVAPAPMVVATVTAGYGDGYPRHLSGKGADVLVRGKRCPVLGRVTMDQIMVDVSHLESVEPGAEVVLIGQQGNESIDATEIADKAGTIAWEILTGITPRVERVYRT